MKKTCSILSVVPFLLSACGDGGNGENGVCRSDQMHAVPFGSEDTTFHVGPYLGHTTTTSVAIGWETLEQGSTRLEYGADETYGQVVDGDAGSMHQVTLTGLEPETRYHYRACTDDQCTDDLVLSTAPPPGLPFRFAVWGDTQDNPDTHRQVAARAMEDQAALAIVVGDLVSNGTFREQYKERFFDPARALAHSVPFYAAIGNHDRKDHECEHFIDYVMYPEDPDVPQAETNYSFTYGDAFFLVYDNTLDHFDFFFPLAEGSEPPLWMWLQAQAKSAAAQNARWRFAFAHYPADSVCREEDYVYGMPESAVREYVLPLLWENGFHAHFSGHVHCYERFDFDGHLVITTGGGGGGLDDEAICTRALPEARKHRCVHHNTTLELGCESARVWARDIDGEVIDEVTLYPDGSHETL